MTSSPIPSLCACGKFGYCTIKQCLPSFSPHLCRVPVRYNLCKSCFITFSSLFPSCRKSVGSISILPPFTSFVSAEPICKPRHARCAAKDCRRRLRLAATEFSCRCRLAFCGRHRDAEAHECTFNYVASAKAVLHKENPLLVADRITSRA